MPIRRELRHFYGREWSMVTRPRILARAGQRCEQCKVPDHAVVTRTEGMWLEVLVTWASGATLHWRDNRGEVCPEPKRGEKMRTVRIVLTIAHLNHVSGDDRDDNLRALCQWCHLHYDAAHHAQTRAVRKDAARPLIKGATNG